MSANQSNNHKLTPEGHHWVETEDGSQTLFSDRFQEACHSTSGAKAETILHYLNGCQILEKAQAQDELIILEVGFGLGMGLETTLESLKDSKTKLTFISLEIDHNLVEWFRLKHNSHPLFKNFKWCQNKNLTSLELENSNISIIILVGDARVTLPQFANEKKIKWHAIYQDAFSPKKNPVLWTREWFELLKAHSHESVLLSTYSSSASIRKSLIESGWKLHAGEKFGKKRTSTRASLIGDSDPEILKSLTLSPILSLTDKNILGAT